MTTPAADPEMTARMESDSPYSPRTPHNDAQFSPGTIVAERYRISSILGSGGMGEVYRADDIKLGQTVALKFLPARLARDPILLDRLHDEVRLGRQIAHPNVCRIYDIIDWDGNHFVAMEYVDGEDLSRLLKRIGRLAHDKAVDITRGIAAGLMGAHAKGILHRDLKPANIMVDSRGDARIMDFGLALAAGDDDGTVSGTPAYMAPEQLEGAPASVQTDLYSLGLVMYELFTGKRVHAARTLPERVRDASEVTIPSSVIRDIEPAVERLILRCLNRDPAQRPRTAREVIDALPGGDPLAAALAAGETPSPRLVAAAGTEGSLKPAVAWSLLFSILICIAFMIWRANAGGLMESVALHQPPEVLDARAAALLSTFGIESQDFVSSGLEAKQQYYSWILTRDHSRWQRIRRGLPLVTFWRRQSPVPLLDTGIGHSPDPTIGRPPQTADGAATIEIDPRGRLYSLSARPADSWKPRPLDWQVLLDAAGLGAAALKQEEPKLVPPSFADTRAAWSGKHPEDEVPIRVEAAAWRGVPVFFRISAPWNEVDTRAEVPFGGVGFAFFLVGLMLSTLVIGAMLAWRNLRLRRGDRQGAFRIATALGLMTAGLYLARADHEMALGHELVILIGSVAEGVVYGSACWLVYVALEPYVRRRWPERLISWVRLTAGDWRDPMVGRDILIGILGGAAHGALASTTALFRDVLAGTPPSPAVGDLRVVSTFPNALAHLLKGPQIGVVGGLMIMIALMVLSMILRRRRLAEAGVFVLMFVGFLFASTELYMLPFFAIIAGIFAFMAARVGLLGLAAMQMSFGLIFHGQLSDGLGWYTMRSMMGIAFVILLALWAFRTALGVQSMFGETTLLDD